MGLMRALQGVATGYLDARVGQFEAAAKAKADKKAMEDKYKAEEAMRLSLQNNEIEKNAELKAIEKKEEYDQRYDSAIALGFTPEFLAGHGAFMLSSTNNFNSYIEMGQKKYKKIDWWKEPIVFGEFKGKNVQEYLMTAGSGGEEIFDGEKVKGNTKERANIPDAIADNQMQGKYKKTEAPKFSGADLFFKKASYATSPGKKYINQTGEMVHGYQIEQDFGEKNWGNTIYYDTYDPDKGEMVTRELPVTFFDTNSETGKEFIKANAKFFDSMEQTEYMVKYNGKYHRISGTAKIYGDRREETLDGLSPYLVELMGLDLSKTTTTLPPMADTTTEIQYHSFNKKDWDAITGGKLELIPYESTEFFNVNKLSDTYRGDINASSMKNYANTALAQAGFIEGADFQGGFTYNQIPGGGYGMEFNAFGDNDAEKAATSFGSIVSDTFELITQTSKNRQIYGINNENSNINSTYVEELQLGNNDPNMLSNDFIASKIGRYYKDIRAREGERNLAILQSFAGDNDKILKFLKDNKSEDLLEKITDPQSLATVAQNITDRQLGTINTLEELVNFNMEVKKLEGESIVERERKAEIEEAQFINNIFPESERKLGNTLESFADYYVKDATDSEDGKKQAELLRVAVEGITDNEDERKALVNRLKIYLDKKELQQLKNKRETGSIFGSEIPKDSAISENESSESEQDIDTSTKSEAQTKDEIGARSTAVKFINFYENEIEDKKAEIENLKKNSKDDTMLSTILQPLETELLNLQDTLVQYQQELQKIDKGYATKSTNLLEIERNK